MSPARKKAARKKAARKKSGAKKKAAARKPAGSGGGAARWIALPIGLLLAAVAAWALLGRDGAGDSHGNPPVASPPHVHREAAPSEHDHYDDESREALREILRGADDEASP